MTASATLQAGAAARIREHNRRTGRRLAVLDDDPTGSQAVHGVSVVTVLERSEYAAGLAAPADTCFVLTNTRALDEAQAVELNRAVAYDLYTLAADTGATVEVVSRSDSTLRGHVHAEIEAIAAEHLAVIGRPVDGVLFCPAMIEAGRFTVDDVHFAVVDGVPTPVGDTEFARDKTFGYTSSNLRDFIAERSGGTIAAADVRSLSLDDIRIGGPERVAEILTEVSGLGWVVVNCTSYADLEVVALGLQLARDAGKTFLTRSGPSFVRALAGIEAKDVLGPADLAIDASRTRHGLIAVGSHVGLTTRQVHEARGRGGLVEVELQVPALLDPSNAATHIEETAARIVAALPGSDVLVCTSRDLVAVDNDPEASLDIARTVSTALVTVVEKARAARPAWVVAKGGITSHDLAARGLGIRRATVAGQFLPGQISLFTPAEAPPDVIGCAFVVFPGNVGAVDALALVLDRLRAATEGDR
ncbi:MULTISPECIES: four-carbon acid sugar kinase family protein [unclassified Kribbella]|uniref:four-carbon acid sugar kinase family protein n=1 Tax=unclassified Kribbella TaxID=2644121 RepID=UPI00340A0351